MSEIEIEIDGKKLLTEPNKMVIQVADDAGIYIPRFCYHKHLSVAANCRMCLVEVEKSPKTLPACATPVMPNMKIFTRSPKALAAQRAVMEFLLINHPLDCPICDQGGECELQDLSMGYGRADSYYVEGKRAVKDQDLGPLIATEMTRCIQCTRCVRFGDEVAGLRELGLIQRGEHVEISTYVQQSMQSEVSGNIIDLCPVGALTSKPFRFKARAWELEQHPSIAPHDCLGSHINVHTRTGTVMRVVPRENNMINQTWLSDRDRFSYEGLYSADRLTKPLIRKNDKWQETDWHTALNVAATELQKVVQQHGAAALGALASPSSTLEEFYLLQKLLRALGSNHLDHRLRQVDFSDQAAAPLFPTLSLSLADIETCDVILLIGSNIQKEQPLAGLRVRKAALNGARVIAVNLLDYCFNFKVAAKKIVAPQHFTAALKNIVESQDAVISDVLRQGKKVCVLMGALALNHPEAGLIGQMAREIARLYHAEFGVLTEGANAAGAWIAGMVPHRGAGGGHATQSGLDASSMLSDPRKGYILLNVEPDLDCANPPLAARALMQAECVVALSLYKNNVLHDAAQVILPIAAFAETSGTYVNALGQWQSFQGVAKADSEARPAWKVLRVLANLLNVDGFEFLSSEEVRHELKEKMAEQSFQPSRAPALKTSSLATSAALTRIGEIPLYATDSLVRHAVSLQRAQQVEGDLTVARLHPTTAAKLHIKDGESVWVKQQNERVRLNAAVDVRVPEAAVWIAGGISATREFSSLFGTIELEKA